HGPTGVKSNKKDREHYWKREGKEGVLDNWHKWSYHIVCPQLIVDRPTNCVPANHDNYHEDNAQEGLKRYLDEADNLETKMSQHEALQRTIKDFFFHLEDNFDPEVLQLGKILRREMLRPPQKWKKKGRRKRRSTSEAPSTSCLSTIQHRVDVQRDEPSAKQHFIRIDHASAPVGVDEPRNEGFSSRTSSTSSSTPLKNLLMHDRR
ncbi:unnamed protein product, partial [Amoebophrya sp. A25]